jgi:hypothetical protein
MASNERIRGAVLHHLREHGVPSSIGTMAEQIRLKNDELKEVPDFDFRSTVLQMMSVGDIELTPTNRIAMPESSLVARG